MTGTPLGSFPIGLRSTRTRRRGFDLSCGAVRYVNPVSARQHHTKRRSDIHRRSTSTAAFRASAGGWTHHVRGVRLRADRVVRLGVIELPFELPAYRRLRVRVFDGGVVRPAVQASKMSFVAFVIAVAV